MKGLKVLKWLGLGFVIWSLSLLWPEINLILHLPVMAGLALLFATISLAYVLGYYHSQSDNSQSHQPNRGKQNHSSRPSRPVPPLSMA